MYLSSRAVVLREVNYKESDKILTLLTEEHGKMTASARGCRKKGSKLSAGCQLLSWGHFVFAQRKGQWFVKEVAVERSFADLSKDLNRFSLACYFAELSELLSIEDLPQAELLSLLLNCFHVLEKRHKIEPKLVKAVFEFRVIAQAGYEPMLECCSFCDTALPVNPQFSLSGGTLHCLSCGGRAFPLNKPTLSALNYLILSPPKGIFSFALAEPEDFYAVCERYLLTQLDRGFKTLDFYKKLS